MHEKGISNFSKWTIITKWVLFYLYNFQMEFSTSDHWYKAKARTEKEQTSFSFGWLQRAAARARHTACQCHRRRFRRRTRPHQAAGSWAAKRRLSVPEAPKYIKVRKVFDLSRLHLALLGLNSSSQADLLWLVTLPLKVKHFVVMYHECTLLIDAH